MITYQHNVPLNAVEVARVFQASGIARPTQDLVRIDRMLAGADLIISAWQANQLVGLARALTDFSYCCYLSDLAVDRAYQHQGIGSSLIRAVQQAIGEEVSLILVSAPTATTYYPKQGFSSIEHGYMIKRLR